MDESVRNDSISKDIGANIFGLKRAVTHEMETRGYQRAAQPDLWVNIGIATKELVQTRQTVYQQDGSYYIGQRNYRWQAQNVPVGKHEEGTATIDVVAPVRSKCGKAPPRACFRASLAVRPRKSTRAWPRRSSGSR